MKQILLIDHKECCKTETDIVLVEGIACYACQKCGKVDQVTSYDASFMEVQDE